VADVLDEMAGPVVVLGHSFGGLVALQLAAARPEAVRGLVLTGSPLRTSGGTRPRPVTRFRVVRALNRAGLFSDARMEEARRRYGSADYRAAEGVMRQVLVRVVGEDYDEALAAVRCPVSLVWGDDDTAAPLGMARAATGRLADAELTVEPGAGHLTPLTVPATLRRAVMERLG
jgi:pimeloyl-ACP methyl ester carboxylesterase